MNTIKTCPVGLTPKIIGHDADHYPIYDIRCDCQICKHNGKAQMKKCFQKQCKCCVDNRGWACIHKEELTK